MTLFREGMTRNNGSSNAENYNIPRPEKMPHGQGVNTPEKKKNNNKQKTKN